MQSENSYRLLFVKKVERAGRKKHTGIIQYGDHLDKSSHSMTAARGWTGFGGKRLVSAAFKGGRTGFGWFQGGRTGFGWFQGGKDWFRVGRTGFGSFRFLVTTYFWDI